MPHRVKKSATENPPVGNSPRLLRAALSVSAMTQVSRVLGLIRDIVFAYVFKIGGATDAFFVAFKIPNFFRRLFAEGAFSQAFVPVLAEYKETRSFSELRALISRTSGTLAAILFVFTALGILFSPGVMWLFAHGFYRHNPQSYWLASDLLKITFPYLFFISLTALAGGILNSFNRFAVPAITPALLNISLIICALWLSPHFAQPVTALAWGVLIAGIAQLLLQLPFLYKLGVLSLPKWGWRDDGVQKIVRLMLPALFGAAVVQLNLLLDTVIATMLIEGSVTWLYYSDRLVEFPLGAFGVALGTVILPALSQKHVQTNWLGFTRTMDWALCWVLVIALPAMTGLVVFAKPILTTLFEYGEFSNHDTQMAAYSLAAYAAGLPAFILIKVLTPGFYARQDTRTPVRLGLIAMVVNMLMNIAIVAPMMLWHFKAPHMGLALATTASAWIHTAMLFIALQRHGVYALPRRWFKLCLQTALACLAMGSLLYYWATPEWSMWTYKFRALYLLGYISIGGGVYVLAMWLVGVRPRDLREHN